MEQQTDPAPGDPFDLGDDVARVERALEELCTERGRATAPLWQSVAAATQGGRRTRPLLLLRAYDALAGAAPVEPRQVAERVAGALELLHTAFLVHDDVIDDDALRRGRPTVSGRHAGRAQGFGAPGRAAHAYGAAAGILAGDLALGAAVREMALCDATPVVTERLLDLVDETLHRTAEGELADVWLGLGRSADLTEVLEMEAGKTAVYTFQLPLRAAAALAGRDELDDDLTALGRDLGLAFQLRDDLAGMFDAAEVTGKDGVSDLREGRCTPLVALARGTWAWERVDALLGSPDLTAADVEEVRGLLTACGARAGAEELADHFAHRAGARARDLGLESLVDPLPVSTPTPVPSAA